MEREEEQEARAQGRCQGNQAGPGFSPLKREGRLPGGLFAVLKRYLCLQKRTRSTAKTLLQASRQENSSRDRGLRGKRSRGRGGKWGRRGSPFSPRHAGDRTTAVASAGTLPAELQAQPWRKEMARSRKAGSPPVWANASGTLRRKQPLPRHCMRQAEYSN